MFFCLFLISQPIFFKQGTKFVFNQGACNYEARFLKIIGRGTSYFYVYAHHLGVPIWQLGGVAVFCVVTHFASYFDVLLSGDPLFCSQEYYNIIAHILIPLSLNLKLQLFKILIYQFRINRFYKFSIIFIEIIYHLVFPIPLFI